MTVVYLIFYTIIIYICSIIIICLELCELLLSRWWRFAALLDPLQPLALVFLDPSS